jgi:hypothetical protein
MAVQCAHRSGRADYACTVSTLLSEQMPMEQVDHDLLFHWFAGLNMDDYVWDVTVFTVHHGSDLPCSHSRFTRL